MRVLMLLPPLSLLLVLEACGGITSASTGTSSSAGSSKAQGQSSVCGPDPGVTVLSGPCSLEGAECPQESRCGGTTVVCQNGIWVQSGADCEGTSQGTSTAHPGASIPAPDGGPVDATTDGNADANPCGDGWSTPTCGPALQGVSCYWEACGCCVSGGTCEDGQWVDPVYNAGGGDLVCPVGSGGPNLSLDGSTCGTFDDAGSVNRSGTCPTGTSCCTGVGGNDGVGCYLDNSVAGCP